MNSMENTEILTAEILKNRRYPHSNKTRKDWKCKGCGTLVEKGNHIEHSYSADGKICIELCLPCVEDLKLVAGE